MEHFNLENNPKIKPGFKVPENYFETFSDRLMQQLPEQEQVKVVPLYRKTTVWLSAVAAVFIIALGISLFFKMNTATQPDQAAIENYLVYQANISSYDLAQHLDQQDIAELEEAVSPSDEAIEDYFLNQNIDINE